MNAGARWNGNASTIRNVIEEHVVPALGDDVDDYDVEAIAHAVSEWQPGDGGELELYQGTWEQPEGEPCLVEPVQGRLVVFRACTVPTWHGVRTITGKRSRKSLAVYWYAEPTGQERNRWRALFAPRPGHQETEEERLARVSRACRLRR